MRAKISFYSILSSFSVSVSCQCSSVILLLRDGGVHALNSTAHFDLERYGTKVFDPEYITYELNKFFYKNETSIHVKKCLRVSDDFSARFNALSRTYLYRLAVVKPDIVLPESNIISSYIPIEEWKRCHFIRFPGFDIEKFKAGAKYLVGYHDFTTFKKFDKLTSHKQNRRYLHSFDVKPGQPLVTSYSSTQDSLFDYWDIKIKGRSFVHNQIRRMVATLISVAIGKIPPEEIKVMLQVPSKHSWYTFIQNCPPDGLYLCNVDYNPEDLVFQPVDIVKETEDLEESDKK
ncbi:PREDICTED: tRNA pseudouridine synthase-like 1 isoform X2 [Papilio polytes]|uniref:tRNA pseudouridine synthase-like 1 isoform X2 n=1 Tax=Papilio polytes TaxID=76194 RepID=UPI000675DA21|nr:PREDICTED: tRNA pseudouridine synthase-like 1 isoform X2 [Papilio polytes]